MSTPTAAPFPAATILGYPRIGPRRELKRAIESYWAGRSDAATLTRAAADLRRRNRTRLAELGLRTDDASIPSDFTFYDQVWSIAAQIGAIPKRFEHLRASRDGVLGSLDLAGHFTAARGEGDLAPLEMTKWFDSNYHYLVPEIGPDTDFRLVETASVAYFSEALADGVLTRPALVGPVTFLLLAKAADDAPEGFDPLSRLDDVVAVYTELLAAFARAGATWVQLDEPALVSDTWDTPREEVKAAVRRAYSVLTEPPVTSGGRPGLFVAAPYNRIGCAIRDLATAGVEAIGVDLVRGEIPDGDVEGIGDVTLVAGVVDGHNVWRTDLDAAQRTLASLAPVGAKHVTISTSTSLLHVPHTTTDEPDLPTELRSWLAFADEKVGEVLALAAGEEAAPELFETNRAAMTSRAGAVGVSVDAVRERTAALTEADFSRGDYATRVAAQDEVLDLPPLPTTTIGSFPQTGDLRLARARLRKGEIDEPTYAEAMKAEIREVIALQERLGLDVLVHGEPERNDMVQYFAEHLDGFATTQNGWVQSYGSRCTRPSILWGDVSRPAPITPAWSSYAASLTDAPVKGMLTGPVTILAWSFVRDDIPLAEAANQVALALRDEIADLQAVGIGIIQVDEPALRELLPLRREQQQAYLDWSVRSFRLATSGASDATQIHTHLCYSEFGEIIDAIDGLDADVTSIEAARSRMEILADIAGSGFERGIGPGVYDIHSPRVPSTAEITELLRAALTSIGARRLWVNPDCGLKTRGYEETVASLEHLVAAARTVRAAG
ncbi:5-methyltetrahydropteroyltriglutamate--homocysteine S-methyltransferase [Pseudactinotalea terrae]|uniref:5-methyltetrahydropteroyltriglutamate-- homocysteine S-methyltransferase n=1 Tax=Pseudactinotalea terrae TaxID=1743262 RepID=UPI0012E14B34|nr:5-methyltetrahydropteroyltriglutamate--homocysteine S-methyltransferase [Pseudactinotalea terrae]